MQTPSQTPGPPSITLELSAEQLEALALRAAEIIADRARTSSQARSDSPYLSVQEAAALLRSKPQRVYDLLSSRRLSRFKDGSRVLISREEVEAYLANQNRSTRARRWAA